MSYESGKLTGQHDRDALARRSSGLRWGEPKETPAAYFHRNPRGRTRRLSDSHVGCTQAEDWICSARNCRTVVQDNVPNRRGVKRSCDSVPDGVAGSFNKSLVHEQVLADIERGHQHEHERAVDEGRF